MILTRRLPPTALATLIAAVASATFAQPLVVGQWDVIEGKMTGAMPPRKPRDFQPTVSGAHSCLSNRNINHTH